MSENCCILSFSAISGISWWNKKEHIVGEVNSGYVVTPPHLKYDIHNIPLPFVQLSSYVATLYLWVTQDTINLWPPLTYQFCTTLYHREWFYDMSILLQHWGARYILLKWPPYIAENNIYHLPRVTYTVNIDVLYHLNLYPKNLCGSFCLDSRHPTNSMRADFWQVFCLLQCPMKYRKWFMFVYVLQLSYPSMEWWTQRYIQHNWSLPPLLCNEWSFFSLLSLLVGCCKFLRLM